MPEPISSLARVLWDADGETIILVDRLLGHLILHPSGYPASWHPLGFIHLKIAAEVDRTMRLHIWPAVHHRRPQVPEWPVHDHIFSLQSRVLCGKVTNISYEVRPAAKDATSRIYQVYYVGDTSCLRATSQLVLCREVKRTVHQPGERYAIRGGLFHASCVAEEHLAATLVITSEHAAGQPRVVGELDGEPEYRYERRPCLPDDLQPALESIVRRLGCP